jgi:hypothetical protein
MAALVASIILAVALVAVGAWQVRTMPVTPEFASTIIGIIVTVSVAIVTIGITSYESRLYLANSERAVMAGFCTDLDKLSVGIKESLDATLKAIEATHFSTKEELEQLKRGTR